MKHDYTYKLLEVMDDEMLSSLQSYVVNLNYVTSNDFQEYAIQVTPNFNVESEKDILINIFFKKYMHKYFSPDGHIGSNIARMSPQSYVSEHSDYTALTYGKMQNNIVKFQIPIITNPGAGLMWAHNKTVRSDCVNMVAGGLYIIDNCRVHSSVNFGNEFRYYLTSRWNVEKLIDKSVLLPSGIPPNPVN
jgi:hypothetical protein